MHPARHNTAATERYGTVKCLRLEPHRRTRTSKILIMDESYVLVAYSGFQSIGIQGASQPPQRYLTGWSWLSMEIDPVTQTRSSSEASLKENLEKTTSLAAYKSTLARNIFFENGSATGMIVDGDRVTYNLRAKKEGILSAGVVGAD